MVPQVEDMLSYSPLVKQQHCRHTSMFMSASMMLCEAAGLWLCSKEVLHCAGCIQVALPLAYVEHHSCDTAL